MQKNTLSVEDVLEITQRGGVVAIVRLDDLSRALDLTRALIVGGITALEFTLTNKQALKVISEVLAIIPEFSRGQVVIGAGTVLDGSMARASIEAGAQFVVAPSTNLETIKVCQEHGIAAMPGALTPTEIMTAWQAGASVVKIFPARSFGPAYIKDLREPLPQLKLMPTGGVSADNAGEYIKNGALAVGAGGNLVDKKLVAAGDWPAITARAAAYVRAVQEARAQ